MIAVQTSFQLYNEMHPVDLSDPECSSINRGEETYMDYLKKALKMALSQVYCNGGSYLHDNEENLSGTPLTHIEHGSEVTEDQPEASATNTAATGSLITPALPPQKAVIERPIIKTPETQMIRSKIRESASKPLSVEQKAIFNSYLQRQKLQLGCSDSDDGSAHAFAP